MKSLMRFSPGIVAAGVLALLTANWVWAQNYSHARIVRLSFVEGNVTVLRPDVQTWAEAPVNTPLQEGFQLSTGQSSFAEIEFENGGTIRLGQLTLLEFTELQLAPNGGKVNHVELRQGYATFHPLPSHLGEALTVGTPCGTLTAQSGTKFRVDLDQGAERVEVFDGTVELQSNLGAMTLEKDAVLVMQPGAAEPSSLSQGITEDDWDHWVDDREARMDVSQLGSSPNGYEGNAGETPYGWNDLSQYGNWSNVPGVGYGWTPGEVSGGWAPYTLGQWCWYPGWGYTWIGAEPWGWLPYHCGGWEYIPGLGWVWFPGGCGTWSPGLVTWYTGPNWIGWRPRPHRKDGLEACGAHCGGGAVSVSTFRHGGRLTSNLMLNTNPATGELVNEPGIIPTTAAKLPGPAVATSAAQSQGFRGRPAYATAGTGTTGAGTASSGRRGTGGIRPNSSIVYDPQHDSYINSHRAPTPPQPSTTSAGATNPATPGGNPAMLQPVPVGGADPNGRAGDSQEFNQPSPSVGSYTTRPAPVGSRTGAAAGGSSAFAASPNSAMPKQGPSTSSATPSASRPGGGSHGGGGDGSAGGHSGAGAAGGGHTGSGSSRGSAGGHH